MKTEFAICPVCSQSTQAPAGGIPMACPSCHSNLARAPRLFVDEEGRLVRYMGRATQLVIPDAVRSVCENVFYHHTELESVTLPLGLLEIGRFAFASCSSLTEITLPATLRSLGEGAFAHCLSLARVTLPRRLTVIPDRLLEGCSSLSAIDLDGITQIGASALAHCTALTEVALTRSLLEIGDHAFFACTGLARIVIPKSVRRVGESVFGFCPHRTAVLCEAPKRPDGWSPSFAYGHDVTWNYRER